MVGDVNLFFVDTDHIVAEVEIMIAGKSSSCDCLSVLLAALSVPHYDILIAPVVLLCCSFCLSVLLFLHHTTIY